MIESLIWIGILFGPSLLEAVNDPAFGFFVDETTTRRHDCRQIDLEEARALQPQRFSDRYPRGDFVNREAFYCRESVLGPEVRSPQHTRIFDQLSDKVQTLALNISSRIEANQTVMVETHHANPLASEKISFATKVALVEAGLSVSDRVAMLPPTELGVIGRLPNAKAHTLSCQRLNALNQLATDEVLLRIIVANDYQTELFAGLCTTRGWSWLQ